MADGLLEAVRGLHLAHPELGPKPLLAKLRQQQPDLAAGNKEVREALAALKAEESKPTEPAAAAPPAIAASYQKRPTLRKYAQETSRVADCENMHSAKIILSPYSLGASPSAPGGRPAPGPRPGGVAEVSPLPRVRGEDMGEDRGVRLATCELRVVRYSLVRPTVSSDDYCTVKRTV